MKTIGLIGGTSWVSTADYYRLINEFTNERLGGLNSARILLFSVNFEEFKKMADEGRWDLMGGIVSDIAVRMEKAGADCILLCANTLHIVADTVREHIRIPLIHIAEATANEISRQRIGKVGLLGTRFTMEKPFFHDILRQDHIDTLIPDDEARTFIHNSIFDELGKGIFTPATKSAYLGIIDTLQQQGATGIIAGCTEIPLIIKQDDCPLPLFDTTAIHVKAAVDFALEK